MKELSAVALIFSFLFFGCTQRPEPPTTRQHDLFNGRYSVEIEMARVPASSSSRTVQNGVVDGRKVAELAEIIWGDNKLRIVDGQLSFNGRKYGKVRHGDRIRVDKDGRLYVGGRERP
jgi:hypothetical protein